jgi:hypothetical protein
VFEVSLIQAFVFEIVQGQFVLVVKMTVPFVAPWPWTRLVVERA